MPSKKKKYNARFPAGRIKKIMQSDEEIGKVAQAVPVIISRTLELFVESLLTKTLRITNARNAKTLSTSHMKQCIMAEQRFDFLRELVKNIPDISVADDEGAQSSPEEQYPDSDTPYDLSMPSTSTRARNNMSGPANGGGGGGSTTNYLTNSFQTQAYNNGNSALNYCKRNSSGGGGGGGSTTPSVIMHTTSLMNADSSILNAKIHNNNKECLPPPKLNRSESTPAQMSMTITPKPIWRPIETSPTTPRKRLKQQKSMPQYGSNDVDADDDNDDNNHNNYNSNNPTARQKLPAAPIVNFDFCTKPIVKIDYSNLPITTTTTCSAPLSAPVLGHHHSELKAPDFSINAPIINIDLSNMMTNATATQSSTSSSSSSSTSIRPAVATISIGALPLPLAPASIAAAAAAASPMDAMSSNKPSSLNMNAAAAAAAVGSTKHNALLELDEDYDNI